jgi:hypothetical protein
MKHTWATMPFALMIILSAATSATATSIVVLANTTQIAVAADSKQMTAKGQPSPDVCKIFRYGQFFVVMAGIINNNAMYNPIQTLAKAAKGVTDLVEIQKRFDRLIKGSLQTQVDFRLANVPGYEQQVRLTKPNAFEIIIFQLTSNGPTLVQSLFPIQIPREGSVTVGNPYHNTCKNGEGECSLAIGDTEEIKQFTEKYHLEGRDLVADATNLVHIEAVAHPDTVGGNINLLLIDSTGTHQINTLPGCPVEERISNGHGN